MTRTPIYLFTYWQHGCEVSKQHFAVVSNIIREGKDSKPSFLNIVDESKVIQ